MRKSSKNDSARNPGRRHNYEARIDQIANCLRSFPDSLCDEFSQGTIESNVEEPKISHQPPRESQNTVPGRSEASNQDGYHRNGSNQGGPVPTEFPHRIAGKPARPW